MIVRWDIEQGTMDWFKLRYGKIGGSDSKSIDVDSETLVNQLIVENVEPFDEFDDEDGFSNKHMDRGHELEPEARDYMIKYTGLEFKECGIIISESNDLLSLSPDGITEDLKVGLEIKCPEGKAHVDMVRKDYIQSEYLAQCVHYFTVNEELERLFFCSYRPEFTIKPIFVKELDRRSNITIKGKHGTVQSFVDKSVKSADRIKGVVKFEIKRIQEV